MKKFILIGLVIILSKLSFVYAGVPKATRKDQAQNTTAFGTISDWKDRVLIKNLIGKTIYRDVPVQNETEYDIAYQNIPYTIESYNENIISLIDKDKNPIVLNRSLWDDGNWKEWTEKKTKNGLKIGDMVQTNNKYNECFGTPTIGKIIDIAVLFANEKEVTLDNGRKLHENWLEKYNMTQTAKKILLSEMINPTKKD